MITIKWLTGGAPRGARYLLVSLILALSLAMPSLAGAAGKKSFETLKGVKAMWVTVTGLSAEAQKDGLSPKEISKLVKKRVADAGISVVDSEKCRQLPGQPHLVVRLVDQKRSDLNLYSMAVVVQLVQRVKLDRDASVTAMAETWGMTGVVSVGTSELNAVGGIILRYVDKFLRAHTQANQNGGAGATGEGDLDISASGSDN